tara:strand:+ start:13861 stop:14364 length:504 start_codon:yes stop_codon:yes gene_type:complete
MATVLFCTKNDIVRQAPYLDGNIDSDKIVPSLHLAQVHSLKQIIGTDLYNKLSSDISASSLTGNYLTLLKNYIKPILIHLALAEFLRSAPFTVSNKGVYKRTSENSSEISSEELLSLVQIERDRAQNYTSRFLDHMSFNQSNYPEWSSNTNEDISPSYESFGTDWVL